jgi:hypothetical protein
MLQSLFRKTPSLLRSRCITGNARRALFFFSWGRRGQLIIEECHARRTSQLRDRDPGARSVCLIGVPSKFTHLTLSIRWPIRFALCYQEWTFSRRELSRVAVWGAPRHKHSDVQQVLFSWWCISAFLCCISNPQAGYTIICCQKDFVVEFVDILTFYTKSLIRWRLLYLSLSRSFIRLFRCWLSIHPIFAPVHLYIIGDVFCGWKLKDGTF